MKNTFTLLLVFGSLFFSLSSFFPSTPRVITAVNPCDAPLIGGGLTAAPGEGSCANSGCHGGTVNAGPATNLFNVNAMENEYIPGQTYPISISMMQSNIDKFGFQITALRDSDNSFIGTYNLTNTSDTRIINAIGRKYVGTTACGSDASSAGAIQWDFEWTAPTEDEGSITFYIITIATNHNHSGSGDFVYTQSLQLNPMVTAVNKISSLDESFGVFPNPADEFVQIEYTLEDKSELIISLMTIDGKEVFKQTPVFQLAGKHSQLLNLREMKLTSGIYFVKITAGNLQAVRRLMVL